VDVSGLVLSEGDLVRASGQVVVDGDAVWFEPPLPTPLVHYVSGPPPPRPSGLGVRAAGVDLGALADGWASLSGSWQDDRLVVSAQAPPDFGHEDAPRWDRPPCPPPAGGWPEGEVDENIDLPPDLVSAYPITAVAQFRPSRRQTVLVVATDEPEQVDAVLRPRYGDRLCVVRSRWARSQVDEVLLRLRESMPEWMIYELGETVAEDGQPQVAAKVSRVVPGLAGWVRTVPDGLLSLSPWLAPLPRPG
jgi:hypothetical protein